MASYDSPIGKRQFTGQPMREYTVPDESGYTRQVGGRPQQDHPQIDEQAMQEFQSRMGGTQVPDPAPGQAEIEQQFREAREAKRTGRERLSEGARRRIEMLVGMSRLTRTVEVEGNMYVLQTLRSRELRDAIIAATAFDGSVQSPFEIRKQLLARSIIQIAGMDADQFVGSHDLEIKLDFIEELDHYLLGRLYDEYLAMVKEAREKYAIKNETDAKEVMEDLKK